MVELVSPLGGRYYLGLVTSAFFRWEESAYDALSDAARLLEDPDIEVLEIGSLPDPVLEEGLAALIRQAGLRRVFSGSGPFSSRSSDLLEADESVRRRALAEARTWIDKAVAVGARVLALAPGRAPYEPCRRPEALRQLARSLTDLASYADDESGGSLYLAVETMDSSIHRHQVLSATGEATGFLMQLRPYAPHVGLLLDLSHIPMVGEHIEEAVATAGPALIHAHVGNCILDPGHPLYGDYHPPFGAPSSEVGIGELSRFLQALLVSPYFAQETGSRGALPFGHPVVSLEVITPPGECPFAAVDSAKQAFFAAMTRCG